MSLCFGRFGVDSLSARVVPSQYHRNLAQYSDGFVNLVASAIIAVWKPVNASRITSVLAYCPSVVGKRVVVSKIHSGMKPVLGKPYLATAELFLDSRHKLAVNHFTMVGLSFHGIALGLILGVSIKFGNANKLTVIVHDIQVLDVANFTALHNLARVSKNVAGSALYRLHVIK